MELQILILIQMVVFTMLILLVSTQVVIITDWEICLMQFLSRGGFAIHGTGRGNWRKLGNKASHGCIRVHPDNALIFNRLVRENGIKNVWITVQN
jgi:hypothetical protein